ncbi:hypothetical protein IRJ41_009233 [Triplophysa rosa]|uniref:Uncharacterized protein n=1 Tax=Triplophysa rosa TaxID=992332 RepID=A0A9W7T2V7_TRIRA|nr:hypothetical protein IRJ41_009233 [Triplophysa rosa]
MHAVDLVEQRVRQEDDQFNQSGEKEVVNDKYRITHMILRWPALFTESQDVSDEDSYHQIPAGVLCVDAESPQLNPSRVCILLEGNSAMEPDNLPQVLYLLFGLIYDLHLDYAFLSS